MQTAEGYLDSGLFWRSWAGDTLPRGVVLIAHGLAEHCGRYEHVAAALTQQSFKVFAVDHLGHGKSPGERVFVESFADYTDGIDSLFELIGSQHPDVPVTILGHSMGGLIAAASVVAHPHRYHGAILSGPAIIAPEPPPAWQQWLVRRLSSWSPKAGVVALESEAISRDPEVVAAYMADPLVYNGKITARLAAELFDAMAALLSNANRIALPLLVMHGTADRLTAPEGSQALVEAAVCEDKTLKMWDGLYHEIFNEPEQQHVFDVMLDWLAARN